MRKNLLQWIAILIIIGTMLYYFTGLLMPTWFVWNTDNTVKGIYKEPDNRIQILFLGSSSTINGISPMLLYKTNGNCAYNLGTPGQPLLSSYYWLREAERLHSKTLNTVVLDTFFLFNRDASFEDNEKALTYMKFSQIKKEAFQACDEQFGNINVLNYLFPLSAYHSRWAQVNSDDFDGMTGEKNFYYTRGQNVSFSMAFKTSDPALMEVPDYGITRESDYSAEEYRNVLGDYNTEYLEKIKDFCDEHGLNLILLGLPHPAYRDLHHDVLQYYADANGIAFLDFNLPEIQETIGMNMAYDFVNPTHPNYWGAEKITGLVGNYLQDLYRIEDIRSSRDYAYLAEQAGEYSALESVAEMLRCEHADDYLRLINNDRYTVFLSVKGDASAGMTDEIRSAAAELGFRELSEISEGVSYVGIKDHGRVLIDEAADNLQDIIVVQGEIDFSGNYVLTGAYTRPGTEGNFSLEKNAGSFAVASAGTDAGDFAWMSIDGAERSENKSGMNFAVYDNVLKSFIGTAAFDTSSADRRRTDMEIPSGYLNRLEQEKLKVAKSFLQYADTAIGEEGSVLFIVGNMSGQEAFLMPEDIGHLKTYGLSAAEEMNAHPYLAVLQDGQVLFETAFSTGENFSLAETEPIPFQIVQDGDPINVYIGLQKLTADRDTVYAIVFRDNKIIGYKEFR